MIYGVDVSNYQPINFALTTPSDNHPVDFAIIKVSEGVSVTNARLSGQRQWARDHGLAVGYYHFGRPGSMIANADFFLSKLGTPAPGESLWFDWEDAGISSAQKDQWIKYVQGKMPGFRVGLYCNTSFWKTRDTSSFAGDGLWIATGGIPAGQPPITAPWLIHQYSTAGDYDHDLAQFATRDDMISWAGGDVALTDAEITKIATRVLTLDGVIESPVDASDHDTNPWWTLESYVKDIGARTRKNTEDVAALKAQASANGSGITALGQALTAANTKLDTIASVLGSIDLSQLPEEIAAKLESLKLVVSVTEGA